LTHAWDEDVPVAETAGVLDELHREGKVGAYGLSNVGAAELRQALGAGAFGWVQNAYSLLERDDERDVLPLCLERGLGYTPFSPLAGGWLTGKYRRGEEPAPGSRMTLRPEPYEQFRDDGVFDRLERFERLAAERGTTTSALSLAWLLGRPGVTAVVVGPRRPSQLDPALAAATGSLETEGLSELFEL
jgi:aryl-alcohol dehydrogenase-like predicted oxidoreductase